MKPEEIIRRRAELWGLIESRRVKVNEDELEKRCGEYWERIGMIVDGIEVDIAHLKLRTQQEAEIQLYDVLIADRYPFTIRDVITTFRYSNNPMTAVGAYIQIEGLRSSRVEYRMARTCFFVDALDQLHQKELFKNLPLTTVEEKKRK